MLISIEQILKSIPHRYPFLLVDKIIAMEENKSIVGIKNVTFNEPHFTGHFPDKPIMPGVLIIEAMAQTASVIETSERMVFSQVEIYCRCQAGRYRRIYIGGINPSLP